MSTADDQWQKILNDSLVTKKPGRRIIKNINNCNVVVYVLFSDFEFLLKAYLDKLFGLPSAYFYAKLKCLCRHNNSIATVKL